MTECNTKRFKTSLRITGDGFNPKEINDLLGLKADLTVEKGEYRKLRSDKLSQTAAKTNMWVYRWCDDSSIPFSEQLTMLFNELGDKVYCIKKLASLEGVFVEVFCGFSSENGQGGDTFSINVLRVLSDNNIHLSLDLYPPEE